MATDKGWNFRDTAGYVIDGANETYVIDTETYPTTRNGMTFGWDVAATVANRDSGIDRRCAGINYFAGSNKSFQVDLPSVGMYIPHLALGDQVGGGNAVCKAEIRDGGSLLATINYAGNVAAQFTDAAGTAFASAALWAAGEAGTAPLTFGSTTFNLVMSSPAGAWVLAHLRIVSLDAAAPRPFITRLWAAPRRAA